MIEQLENQEMIEELELICKTMHMMIRYKEMNTIAPAELEALK